MRERDRREAPSAMPDPARVAHAVRAVVRARINAREVDDLVQDVLCQLLRPGLAERVLDWPRFAARVARDACRAHHRRRSGRPRLLSLEDVAECAAPTGSNSTGSRASRAPTLATSSWIRDVLAPALDPADQDGAASAPHLRRRALLREIARERSPALSIKELARRLRCEPVQVRRDLEAIATRARFLGLHRPPPPA